ncbi:hypothetical protein JK364_03080 [Streptomyces sp. 110]|uniref:Integral membrane protein n=1 Tax=Streptomyces endocoffeicus TaxID=2898945 RepID=A0ABS1PH22_9ACTN|nr:hypothetical protein [Streptomyces endocoffeicus]MBL1111399.1 hypothetical protein [Streptomyces endocoffeicus]
MGTGQAAFLAAAIVLLPLLGQAILAGRLPAGAAVVCCVSAAFLGSLLCARRSLAPQQVLAGLGGAQVALHLGYTLPGVCAAAGSRAGAGWLEYTAASGHPSWEMPVGHAVTVVTAARLLGVMDAVLRPLRTLATAARQRLALRLPGPMAAVRRLPLVPAGDPGRTAVAFRAPPRRGERAPPSRRVIPRVPSPIRPVPGGGIRLV